MLAKMSFRLPNCMSRSHYLELSPVTTQHDITSPADLCQHELSNFCPARAQKYMSFCMWKPQFPNHKKNTFQTPHHPPTLSRKKLPKKHGKIMDIPYNLHPSIPSILRWGESHPSHRPGLRARHGRLHGGHGRGERGPRRDAGARGRHPLHHHLAAAGGGHHDSGDFHHAAGYWGYPRGLEEPWQWPGMNDECFGMGDDSLGSYIRMMIKSGNIWFGLCFFCMFVIFWGLGWWYGRFPIECLFEWGSWSTSCWFLFRCQWRPDGQRVTLLFCWWTVDEPSKSLDFVKTLVTSCWISDLAGWTAHVCRF